MRYAIAGGTVASVTIATTVTLGQGFRVPYELAFGIGYSVALVVHFSLQRWFVWAHHEGFALPIHQQLARYLPLALSNYALVAAAIAWLPRLLGVSTLAAYLGATATITLISFILLRSHVFHPDAFGEGS
jgi:putative flippase GtrA